MLCHHDTIPSEVHMSTVHTVSGPIDSDTIGLTLPHEHVLVDFVGAEESGPDRYDRDDVVLLIFV